MKYEYEMICKKFYKSPWLNNKFLIVGLLRRYDITAHAKNESACKTDKSMKHKLQIFNRYQQQATVKYKPYAAELFIKPL